MGTVPIPPGTVFGRLTAIEPTRTTWNRQGMLCRCVCGTEKVVTLCELRSGHTRSCGCSRRKETVDLARLQPGEVPLYGRHARGRVALVDDGDYTLVMQYRWHVREVRRPSGGVNGPYAITGYGRATIFMHNLIMGQVGIDHANGYGLDNRRLNLRPATNGQNMANRRANINTSSPYKGVDWAGNCGSGKWRARIRVNGARYSLGFFDDEREAAEAYDAAARVAFGEFARTNFPG
jgi:hypothetical protein